MRKIFIIIIQLSCLLLYSTEIDFESSFELALKNSTYIKNLTESLRISEIEKNSVILPGSMGFSLNASPGLIFNSNGGMELSKGSIGFTATPLTDISVSATHTFDKSTSASLSYNLLKSSKQRDTIVNSYLIKRINVNEAKSDFYTEFKKNYLNIQYCRNLLNLDTQDLELSKRELQIRITRVESGIESQYGLQESKLELMGKEIDLLNSEIVLLKLETDFGALTGVDITEIELKPLKLPGINDIKIKMEKENFINYKESSEFLTLMEAVRDQKKTVKDLHMDNIPKFIIGTSLITENFKDFTGAVTLTADFTTLLNHKGELESGNLHLSIAERELKEGLDNFYKLQKYITRENIISLKKIKLLQFNSEKSEKSLKINEYKFSQGEILIETLEREKLNLRRIKLELKNTKSLYIIETLSR